MPFEMGSFCFSRSSIQQKAFEPGPPTLRIIFLRTEERDLERAKSHGQKYCLPEGQATNHRKKKLIFKGGMSGYSSTEAWSTRSHEEDGS